MNLLPKASGTRPRVACDISTQGVVAARSDAAGSPLAAVSRVELAAGAVVPGLKPGNVTDRVAVAAAVRKTLESVGMKPNSRDADITLVIPDAAVRVLLLDFDSLPTKLTEALPLVRFRLKKMLPFDADDAMVTFQVMSTNKSVVRVLAVAIPRDVLSEYETAAREAGYEPGAVVPSTLAALAAMDEDPALLINANVLGVTAAIVRGGILMLHRSVDLQVHPVGTPANLPPALFDTPSSALPSMTLPLVSVDDTASEWAAQQALPEHGRNPYADRVGDEAAVQDVDGITGLPVPYTYAGGINAVPGHTGFRHEPGSVLDSPYASPMVDAELSAELHNSVLIAPTSLRSLIEDDVAAQVAKAALHEEPSFSNQPMPLLGEEIAQAVSVAVAYFEDTLAAVPERILSAGPLGAVELNRILMQHGLAQADGLKVRELVESDALLSSAVTGSVPRGWLSGVLGALHG
jgi:type IV pilus assembly protein PilM